MDLFNAGVIILLLMSLTKGENSLLGLILSLLMNLSEMKFTVAPQFNRALVCTKVFLLQKPILTVMKGFLLIWFRQ